MTKKRQKSVKIDQKCPKSEYFGLLKKVVFDEYLQF